jgi:hypothetical protein
MFIPDLDLDFFTHPGSRCQNSTGSRIRIRNTGLSNIFIDPVYFFNCFIGVKQDNELFTVTRVYC